MRAGTLLTTWFTRTGHGHDLGVLAVVNMEWLVRSGMWGMGTGWVYARAGNSPLTHWSLLLMWFVTKARCFLDLDALCVKEGVRN